MADFIKGYVNWLRHFFSNDVLHLSKTLTKRVALLFVFLSFIGFVDTLYLTVEHYRGGGVNCVVLSGCDAVLSSSYALVFGIPLALIGVIYYFLIFSSVMFFVSGHPERFFKVAMALSAGGFLASLWFIFLQLFIIKSICFYCMVSAFSSIIMFLAAYFLSHKIRRIKSSFQ